MAEVKDVKISIGPSSGNGKRKVTVGFNLVFSRTKQARSSATESTCARKTNQETIQNLSMTGRCFTRSPSSRPSTYLPQSNGSLQ